jgi:hypothetical protein
VDCVNINADGRVVDESFCTVAANVRMNANRRKRRQHRNHDAGQVPT